MKTSLASLALLATLATTSVAMAESNVHDGFYFQLTGGLGYYSASAEQLGTEVSYSGMTIPTSLLLGGQMLPGLTVGGGIMLDYSASPSYSMNGTENPAMEFTQMVLGLGAFGTYHLDPSAGGLYLQGFFGWGGIETSVNGGVGGSDPTGMFVAVGAGYDWWISEEWSAGVLARLTYAPFSLANVGYTTIAPAVVAALTYN